MSIDRLSVPTAIAAQLKIYRSDLEYTPASVATAIELARTMIENSDWNNSDCDPLCTARNVGAILDCARLAADRLGLVLGNVWELLDRVETSAAASDEVAGEGRP